MQHTQGITTPPIQTTTTPLSSISALARYYESMYPTATPQEILSYVTSAISQQQQPQQSQTQNTYQTQPQQTQQTQATQSYYPNTYGNQSNQSIFYPYGNYPGS
jgi:hypothetical protein